MLGTYNLLFVFILFLLNLVHAEDQSGFISIDCGRPFNSSYSEESTGLIYVSDTAFIDTGVSKSISEEYKQYYHQQRLYLRSFPDGIRNCYKITNITTGSKYLIRAGFLYGNYDGRDTMPEFDLYLGSNFWDSINFTGVANSLVKEIIHIPLQNYLHICLVNTGFGVPIISSIEFRPLGFKSYRIKTESLALVNRWDTGPKGNKGYRYPADTLDRYWYAYFDDNWSNISTPLAIDPDTYNLPSVVMSTAAMPKSENTSMEYWLPNDTTSQYFVYLHFAEIEKLLPNQSREFTVSYNGELFEPNSPKYLHSKTVYSSSGLVGGERLIISKTSNSTHPPILSAIEVYVVKEFSQSDTHETDAETITKMKSTYGIKKNWQGDPCTVKYLWEGLNCSYSGQDPPRIISLNLSSSGLTGEIPLAISNLTMLEVLDLSGNNFTGSVPEFLSKLPNLRTLNLKKNNLSGLIPVELVQKSNEGSLQLSVDENPNLCVSVPCKKPKEKKKKNNVVPVLAAAVTGTFILLLSVTAVWWGLKRKQQHVVDEADVADEKSISQHVLFETMQRQFTWSEILRITNNFERVLGKGGFGTVYHGYISNTQVAVKVLSASSVQGFEQFHSEVNLLMKVHHRNLTSLVGYCNDGTNAGLIYEYMANGNLQTHISDDSLSILKWEDRLRIAIEAAQGLEYLHDGCKPPIVHRDVKSSNILLTENFQAKMSDLGLSKIFPTDNKTHISTIVAGTPGYLDPEYYRTNRLNEKSDVYSYGVVLLEIISSRPVVATTHEKKIHISTWVSSMLAKGDITSIADRRLQGNFDTDSVWKAVEVAMACVSPTPNTRPTMNQVVVELKECLAAENGRVGMSHDSGFRDSIEMVSLSMTSELRPLAR